GRVVWHRPPGGPPAPPSGVVLRHSPAGGPWGTGLRDGPAAPPVRNRPWIAHLGSRTSVVRARRWFRGRDRCAFGIASTKTRRGAPGRRDGVRRRPAPLVRREGEPRHMAKKTA